MLSLAQTTLLSLAGLIVLALSKLWPMVSRAYNSSLKNLPGPPSPSWFYGNIKAIQDEDNSVPQERWAAEYGPVISYKGFLGLSRLWTTDTRALNHVLTHSTDYQKPEAARRNLAKILGKGFNYNFDSLRGKPNELNAAFQEVFNPGTNFTIFMFLKNVFPALDIFPDERAKRLDHAQEVMRRIGLQLIEEKKAQIAREMSEGKSGGVERKDVQGRDLLTLLMKANMATDIPDNQRLSDEDVLAQVPTFLVAGHETTSTATMWCLYALTQAPEVQKKLRDEMFTLQTEAPTMDELSSLPYLDAVVRETLRVHAPVPTTMRIATKDDVIPVSEPFVDRHGKLQDSIHISKGSPIIIPVLSLNRSTELWGADALEFKPERWINPPEAISSIPGVWGHMLSFLGGPRACIGYRFSLIEMKALLFALVRAFEFELAVPASDIQKKTSIVQRPLLRSAPEQGSQMPLLVRRFKRAQG
ncbi:Cytochrome P450 3A28 [Trametes pubescens]|uniref:Cytochrome P450 3A28 n=1 Tax=Trametes pubescens TaxID=154538 RepID=A0A1M2VWI7_TRAPU|nr:Cytochrome P450 3A28 [Trametes pubescens]